MSRKNESDQKLQRIGESKIELGFRMGPVQRLYDFDQPVLDGTIRFLFVSFSHFGFRAKYDTRRSEMSKEVAVDKKTDTDLATISSVKKEIQALKKRKEQALASPDDKRPFQVTKIRRKIKRLKRLTRFLAHKASPKTPEQPAPAATEGAPASE